MKRQLITAVPISPEHEVRVATTSSRSGPSVELRLYRGDCDTGWTRDGLRFGVEHVPDIISALQLALAGESLS